jgi:hypothetical protein
MGMILPGPSPKPNWQLTGHAPSSGTVQASIMAQPNAANSVSCGWAEKTVRYTPGQVQYYWFRLHTDFCWDGYNVQGTPGVWHDGGASWGWSYSGSFQSLNGWPAPQAWKSYAGCTMAYAWYLRNHPWVQQIVNGQGWVQTSWSDT